MAEPVYARFLTAIEDALREHWSSSLASAPAELRNMIAYHMGWEDGKATRGKRIRPALILLIVDDCGKDWYSALPAAVAVEWLHNFSLIHDDIQDQSEIRHGRDTLWTRWGIPQAINTGDSVFSLAFLALTDARKDLADGVVTRLISTLAETCMQLTEGQHLDMRFEQQALVTEADYLGMVSGKTAALLGCCTAMGGILSSLTIKQVDALRRFGVNLGMAFQIQDDNLGIWGESSITGKSSVSDLTSGKKSLPILRALNLSPAFQTAWMNDHTSPQAVEKLMTLLDHLEVNTYTQSLKDKYTAQSLAALDEAFPDNPQAAESLVSLASQLLKRES